MKVYWSNLIAIGIGAALGTISRYWLNIAVNSSGYPFGTLIENFTGSFILGFLSAWFVIFVPKEWVKTGLGVGLCGGFTTMSTLAADTIILFQAYTPIHIAIYVFGSMIGGVLLAYIGFLFGTLIANKRKWKIGGERG